MIDVGLPKVSIIIFSMYTNLLFIIKLMCKKKTSVFFVCWQKYVYSEKRRLLERWNVHKSFLFQTFLFMVHKITTWTI